MWTGRVVASSGQTQGLADQRLRLLPGHALEGSARSRGRGAATLLVGRLARKPVLHRSRTGCPDMDGGRDPDHQRPRGTARVIDRSEEHTSELQSPCNLVCRLLLEKKKINDM